MYCFIHLIVVYFNQMVKEYIVMQHFIDYAKQQADEARKMAEQWPASAKRMEQVAVGWDAVILRLENEKREQRWEA